MYYINIKTINTDAFTSVIVIAITPIKRLMEAVVSVPK